MASCKQVETMLQAWIDRDLGPSERVIIEQHLAECKFCASLLLKQQRAAAFLFEVLGEHRLKHDLRQSVMENLPEMEPSRMPVGSARWHSKAPSARKKWWAPVIPAIAATVVLSLAALLYGIWPSTPEARTDVVGMVTQSVGAATCMEEESAQKMRAAVKAVVACGNRYETAPGARLMLALRGPTHLRVDENTRLRVCDDREVSVETGHVLLDVSKDERPFLVDTPSAKIIVHGTLFDVRVSTDRTVVTLKTGKVSIDNGVATSDLFPGEQVEVFAGQKSIQPRKVDVDGIVQWADMLNHDKDAYNLFVREVQARSPAELPAEQVFVVIPVKDNQSQAVASFILTWKPGTHVSGHCSYDVHVYSEGMVELFKDHVDGSVFADPTRTSYQLEVPGEPIRNMNVIHVKVVPDLSTGNVITELSVKARTI